MTNQTTPLNYHVQWDIDSLLSETKNSYYEQLYESMNQAHKALVRQFADNTVTDADVENLFRLVFSLRPPLPPEPPEELRAQYDDLFRKDLKSEQYKKKRQIEIENAIRNSTYNHTK